MHGALVTNEHEQTRDNDGITRPVEASSNLTGHSRTEATKQYEAGSFRDAVGYQRKSRMGDGWRREAVGRIAVTVGPTSAPSLFLWRFTYEWVTL